MSMGLGHLSMGDRLHEYGGTGQMSMGQFLWGKGHMSMGDRSAGRQVI